MQVNCHTHIFNLKTAFTERAAGIFAARLEGQFHLPAPVCKAILYLIGRSAQGTSWNDLLGQVPDDPEERSAKLLMLALQTTGRRDDDLKLVLSGLPRAWGISGWVTRLRQFAKDCKDWTVARCQVDDVLAWIQIAFSASVDDVADELVCGKKGMPQDAIAVPLMMDIYDGKDPDPFPAQLAATARQVLRYPGRILPFVAVNPRRHGLSGDCFTYMVDALTNRGFVGVKLYPSLGDSLDCDVMDRVFAYCNDNRVPITMHCSQGGFSQDPNWRLCDPLYWWKFLDKYRDLVIDFAHFGNFEGVAVSSEDKKAPYTCSPEKADQWQKAHTPYALQIIRLMQAFPGRVYSDIAYHTEPWSRKKGERERYTAQLEWIIQQPVGNQTVSDYLLWGSDFWMMRLVCSERQYWDEFTGEEGLLPEAVQAKMTDANPCRFLRFNEEDSTIAAYVKHISEKRDSQLQRLPPPEWLQMRLDADYPCAYTPWQ